MSKHHYLAGWIAVALVAGGLGVGVLARAAGSVATDWVAGRVAARTLTTEVPMDVDGDGRVDLVRVTRAPGNHAIAQVWRSDGDGGFVAGPTSDLGSWCLGGDCRFRALAMDLDGDGRMDLVREVELDGVVWAYVWVSDGGGFSLRSLSRVDARSTSCRGAC